MRRFSRQVKGVVAKTCSRSIQGPSSIPDMSGVGRSKTSRGARRSHVREIGRRHVVTAYVASDWVVECFNDSIVQPDNVFLPMRTVTRRWRAISLLGDCSIFPRRTSTRYVIDSIGASSSSCPYSIFSSISPQISHPVPPRVPGNSTWRGVVQPIRRRSILQATTATRAQLD